MGTHITTIATMLREDQDTIPLGVMCVLAVVVVVVSTIITEHSKDKTRDISQGEASADQETVLQQTNNEHEERRSQDE